MSGRVSRTSRRRFTRRQWSRRLLRLRAGLVLVGLLMLVGGMVWAVGYSTLLDVRTVEIRGLRDRSGLVPDDIRSAARVPVGEPLARVDLDAVRERVSGISAVRKVAVTRGWPHTVVIEVHERKPVAAWRDGSEIKLVGRNGVVIREVSRVPSNLETLVVRAGSREQTRPLLTAGARVARALPPSLGARVELIGVKSPDAVRLRLDDGSTVMWGSAERSEQKVKVLRALLPQDREEYDVSVPDYPTVKG